MKDKVVEFLRVYIVVILFVIAVLLVCIALPDHHHRNPHTMRLKERQSCIERGGSVKEDYRGYYDGCILSGNQK